ncbi:NADH-quinone oxidoreductase subunit C [Yinghuangia seranimata]|uniref:NADH-quinone oxidoreductase subunit C n=1 Tax=Yinghuangia seranimata TaxID=408067 RepID=UPI00248C7292|nr:NADH-quinone oxidoreductase subunit C [Yinghuangia seranimata]MDI2126965.1 NADH-quinone oxidoreductase subunit C [Yinghuangia seranimata]
MTPDEIRGALGDVAVSDAYGLTTVDVPADRWIEALTAARDELGLTYFDWLTAVDELADGFTVAAHLCTAPGPRLLLRTRVPRDAAHLPTATGVYAGAAWHERETAEMFGVVFDAHPHPVPLLLPEGFEGHPLRKDFILASRVAKPWPGAKEPGESDAHTGAARSPGRRRILPPGVPDPAEWGPHATEPAPEPAPDEPEAPRVGRAGRTPGDRPARPDRPRRTRSASQGSASQKPGDAEEAPPSPESEPEQAPQPPADGPRRARRASDGSTSRQTPAPEEAPPSPEPESRPEPQPPAGRPRRARRASDGSASQDVPPAAPPAPEPPSSAPPGAEPPSVEPPTAEPPSPSSEEDA